MQFIKFQEEKYLEPIKDGVFYFRPVQSFRDDPMKHRGDSNEGITYLDVARPGASFKINNVEIIQLIESIAFSKEYEGNTLSLSLSKLDLNNCHEIESGIYTINEDFLEEMRNFGSSFIIIEPIQFIESMKKALSKCKCNYEYRSIYYCDKRDGDAVQKHFDKMKEIDSWYGELFLKDIAEYGLQNEWRFLIHDIANEFPLTVNGGVNIQTTYRSKMPIFHIDDLNTLQISKEFLI